VHRREDGNSWDFFRGRLMFPIHDRRGRVTGFGARALDDSTPKYINTAATPIFDKRGTLYGLHLAAEAIRAKSAGIVVEGYMDVLAAHQHGHTNVVASMGTALTGQQVSRLKSMATKFILALDPDAAGQEATLRSLESSWRVFEGQAVDDRRRSVGVLYKREPLTLKIAALPQGRDPDKLIREDLNQWERLIEDAVPAQEFYISSVVSKFDRSTAQGKAQAVEVLRPVVVSTDPVEQDHYLNMVADAVKVDKEAVKASIGRPRRAPATASRRRAHYDGPGRQEIVAPPLSSGAESSLEDHTLALLLSRPELRTHAAEFAPEHFHGSEAREVFTRWMASSTIDDLRDSLDESLHDHLTFLTQKELVATQQIEDEAALGECLQRLKSRHLKGLQEALLASEDAGVPPPREMERQIVNLNAQLKETFAQRPQ
jgi:DNA primase